MQTWDRVDLIYPMVTKDNNFKPVKPVLMAEGAYEHGSEYGFAVTPLWVRRQAYYSYLAGGHHACCYGAAPQRVERCQGQTSSRRLISCSVGMQKN